MTIDSDYAYLQVFVDIFNQMIDAIIRLINAITGKNPPEEPTSEPLPEE